MNTYQLAQIYNPVINKTGSRFTEASQASSGVLLAEYFALFWRTLISLGALAAILFLLWGALDWITAGGDEGKIQSARSKITQSVIGLVILAGSFAIVGFIGELVGFDLLKITFPTAENKSLGY